MGKLKNKLIRLAYEKPHLRPHVLPLIREHKQAFQIPTTGLRDYGTWFIKKASITPLSPYSAMVHVVLESTRTAEVRTISKQLDGVPGVGVKFQIQNIGGRDADVQELVVLASVDGNEVNPTGLAKMTLSVDPVQGDWDKGLETEWKW